MPASQRIKRRLKLEVFPEWWRSNFKKAPCVKAKKVFIRQQINTDIFESYVKKEWFFIVSVEAHRLRERYGKCWKGWKSQYYTLSQSMGLLANVQKDEKVCTTRLAIQWVYWQMFKKMKKSTLHAKPFNGPISKSVKRWKRQHYTLSYSMCLLVIVQTDEKVRFTHSYTVKKVSGKFPPPARMWLTKLFLVGNIKLFPSRESLVSDIPSGDGKTANLFLQCISHESCRNTIILNNILTLSKIL